MNNWHIDSLFGSVKFEIVETDGRILTILFENEPYLGRPTKVFAYLGIPHGNARLLPGMVCVHGGGGKAFRQWVEMWVERGYAALAMDLSGRDGKGDRLPNGGPEQDHASKFSVTAERSDMWTYHAIAAVMRSNSILRGLPGVDAERIGITGISWGGYVTCIAAGVDPRFRCAIPVYGCGFLERNSADEWMQIFAEMTPAQRQAWSEQWDPSVYLSKVAIPMLFVSGTNDFAYPLDSLEASCALPLAEVTRSIRVEMPHSHDAGWAPPEIGLFADQHLAGGIPMPKIEAGEFSRGFLKASYTNALPIRNPALHYTKSKGAWKERKWQSAPANLTETTVEAALPRDVSACFLSIEDDRGARVSSPCLEIPPPSNADVRTA